MTLVSNVKLRWFVGEKKEAFQDYARSSWVTRFFLFKKIWRSQRSTNIKDKGGDECFWVYTIHKVLSTYLSYYKDLTGSKDQMVYLLKLNQRWLLHCLPFPWISSLSFVMYCFVQLHSTDSPCLMFGFLNLGLRRSRVFYPFGNQEWDVWCLVVIQVVQVYDRRLSTADWSRWVWQLEPRAGWCACLTLAWKWIHQHCHSWISLCTCPRSMVSLVSDHLD